MTHRLLQTSAVCVALALAAFTRPAAQADPASYIARIEGPQAPAAGELDALSLAQLMEHFHVPGVSVAVIHDFQVHWAKGYGSADVVTGAAVGRETVFQAASISKPVAAMGVLKAAQDGRIDLDDDVNVILTSWKVPAGDGPSSPPITPRALLSHTSGAGDGFRFPGYHPDVLRPTVVQILNGARPSNVGPVLFARPPYRAFKYSGGGVTIMQLAMSDLYGREYPLLIHDLVLGPLGMTRSFYEQPLSREHDRNAARAHDAEGRAMDAKWHVYPELAAAGLWTTPTDLATFAVELQQSLRGRSARVLRRETAREMIAPVGVGPFAVGLQIAKTGEGWYFSHGGSNWGFRAALTGHVRQGYGAAVMTNADRGGQLADVILRRIAAAYGWDSLDKPLPR